MTDRWCFDRASEFYDRTRALGERAMRDFTDAVAGELRDRGSCLEVGVGTGRVALPLSARGISLVGVDISARMVAKLLDKAGRGESIALSLADAEALPFRAGSFGAALACHVLHLVPGWPTALKEVVRVVRGGGVFVAAMVPWSGWWAEIGDRFAGEAGLGRRFPGAIGMEEVAEVMRDLGAAGRIVATIVDQRNDSPAERIDQLEAGLYSFAWQAEPEVRRRAAAAVTRWAQERWGSLDERRPRRIEIDVRAFDLPDPEEPSPGQVRGR